MNRVEEGYNIKELDVKTQYEFNSIIANRLNGTLRYLRKTSALNFRLMSAIYKTAEGVIKNDADMEKIETIQEYTICLVKLHYVLDEMQGHLRDLKEALDGRGNRLSSFLLSPKELHDYIEQLESFSNYKPTIQVQGKAAIYYNLIDTILEKEDDMLKLLLPIPISKQEDETNWKKIEIKLTPFTHNETTYKIIEAIETQIIYNEENFDYFNSKDCRRKQNTLLCKPEYYKYTTCLEKIIIGEEWEINCALAENSKEIFNHLHENTYIYMEAIMKQK